MDELVGREFDFFGVDDREFKLDETVYRAVEDEDDGYRSYLDSVVVTKPRGLFFPFRLARVRVEKREEPGINGSYRSFTGYVLVGVDDGRIWLKVGTEDFDDWYPMFVFNYCPGRQS